MKLDHYPPQDPLSAVATAYHDKVMALGENLEGDERSYGHDPSHTLTVFAAPDPSGEVLVFFHGGGWTNGYKEWMYFMAPALLAQGITLVCPTYRLAPEHVFPACLDDAADAVRWVAQNIAHYGADPEKIYVGGHSAGGHLAALLGVSAHWSQARGLPAHTVKGLLPVSGVFRFDPEGGLSTRPRFLGSHTDTDRQASPLHHLPAGRKTPFFISYGERDFPHLIRQADEFVAALRQQGHAVETMVFADADHFGANLGCGSAATGGWVDRTARWMKTPRQG